MSSSRNEESQLHSVQDLDPAILQRVARQISAKHVEHLALSYLGFTLPQLDDIRSDNIWSINRINTILSLWSNKVPRGKAKLCEILTEAGRKEGLIRVTAIHILNGNVPLSKLTPYATNPLPC